tara:strand:- start:1185 stop:1418 length:234 start_codon:yes stop_codon:yes gene_type:complete
MNNLNKVTDILSFPSTEQPGHEAEKIERQPISYKFRGWQIQETASRAFTATSPDGTKTWTCSSLSAAWDVIDMEVDG